MSADVVRLAALLGLLASTPTLAVAAGDDDALGAEAAPENRAISGEEIWAAHEGIWVFDAAARRPLGAVNLDEVVSGIAFSRDGDIAYVGTSGPRGAATGGGLHVVDATSRQILSTLTRDPVKEVRLDAGGKGLHILEWTRRPGEGTPGAGQTDPVPLRLRSFDLSGSEPKSAGSVPCGPDFLDFAVAPDGKTAFLLDPTRAVLRLLDPGAGDFVGSVDLRGGRSGDGTGYRSSLAKLVVDGEGARAAVLVNGDERWGAILVDLIGCRERRILLPGRAVPRAGRFLPGGKLGVLAIGKFLVLDIEAGKVNRTIPLGEPFTSLAVSGNGSEIYLGTPAAFRTPGAREGGLLQVRDGDSFASLTTLSVPAAVRILEVAPVRPKPPTADSPRRPE